MLGAPGSGKGTQSKRLAEEFGFIQFSTGDMLREEATQEDEFGREIKKIMAAGQLVPDEVITRALSNKLDKTKRTQSIIFDGFPRTIEQAEALDVIMSKRGTKIDRVIELDVDDDAIVERISGRFTCTECGAGYHEKFQKTKVPGVCDSCNSVTFEKREDDNAVTVRERLKLFYEVTSPIISYYSDRGILDTVNGMLGIDTISNELNEIIRKNA